MYGYKLVRAAKQSGLKRFSKWYRSNHTKQYKYLHCLMAESRFVKKSRRKSEHLCDLLSLQLEGKEILKYLSVYQPMCGKVKYSK